MAMPAYRGDSSRPAGPPVDHEGRMKQLKTLFDSFSAEQKRLVEQARQKQAQMNNKSHQAG